MACHFACPRCPVDKNFVPGEGNQKARVMFVFEQPGKMEDELMRPMVGKTGKELDYTYMPRAGLNRDKVWLTNTVKVSTASSGKAPHPDLVESCSRLHLKREIERIRPEIIVLSGGVACSLVPGLDLELEHGIPRKAKLFGWEGIVFPTYHPALGMHMPARMTDLLEDFTVLRSVIYGQYKRVKDEVPKPRYERLKTAKQVRGVLEDVPPFVHIAVDTESAWGARHYTPWSGQFAVRPDEAWMVKVGDTEAWEEFGIQLLKFSQVVMHNATHDIRTLRDAGVPIDYSRRIQDTMQRAYHLGLPQGLKVLGRRLLGVHMRTFEEVTRPYAMERAVDYLMEAAGREWPTPEPIPTGVMELRKCQMCDGKGTLNFKRGKRFEALGKALQFRMKMNPGMECPTCGGAGVNEEEKCQHPQGMTQKLNRLIGDWLKSPDSIDPWERWDNWEGDVVPVVERMGQVPRPCITLVPEDEAVQYACQDAAVTWRVYPLLVARAAGVRRRFKERRRE